MLSNTEIVILFAVGVLFALRWIAQGVRRKSLETQVLQALDGVQNAERHYQGWLSETNVPAYVEVKLMSLDVERNELNAMLAKIRAGEKVTLNRIYWLEKLVAEYTPGSAIMLPPDSGKDHGAECIN